jgi:hypothetical protein
MRLWPLCLLQFKSRLDETDSDPESASASAFSLLLLLLRFGDGGAVVARRPGHAFSSFIQEELAFTFYYPS